jgi:hypothetical protein
MHPSLLGKSRGGSTVNPDATIEDFFLNPAIKKAITLLL